MLKTTITETLNLSLSGKINKEPFKYIPEISAFLFSLVPVLIVQICNIHSTLELLTSAYFFYTELQSSTRKRTKHMPNSVLHTREAIGVLVLAKRLSHIIKAFEWDLSAMFQASIEIFMQSQTTIA